MVDSFNTSGTRTSRWEAVVPDEPIQGSTMSPSPSDCSLFSKAAGDSEVTEVTDNEEENEGGRVALQKPQLRQGMEVEVAVAAVVELAVTAGVAAVAEVDTAVFKRGTLHHPQSRAKGSVFAAMC